MIREIGDITIGFAGFPWHTHGDVLAGELQLAGHDNVGPQEATERFVADVTRNRLPIGVAWSDGEIKEVWATYLYGSSDDRYRPDDERVEFRRWDGEPWE